MAAQIGYYDTLKSVAGKVFTFLASITLTGTDGKTITCTANTTLDEAVSMSSKAPKASPSFTGKIVNNVIPAFTAGDTVITDIIAGGGFGLFIVTDGYHEVSALFLANRYACTLVAGDAALWSNTKDTAGHANLYYDTGWKLQNLFGHDGMFHVSLIGRS